MNQYLYTAKTVLTGITGIILIRLLWVLAHWGSSRIYPYFCAPEGLFGLFLSPFVSQAPHCIALFWIIEISRRCIKDMWLVIGTYVTYRVSVLMAFNHEETKASSSDKSSPRMYIPSPKKVESEKSDSRENMFIKFWKKRVEHVESPVSPVQSKNDSEEEQINNEED
jgi:hypothetical protein